MKTNKDRLNFIKTVDREYEPPTIYFFGTEYYGETTLENGAKLGFDGFGYEWDGERLIGFPHRGDVKIGKDVEIGCNTCIARATMPGVATEIGDGTKIDNLTHIAHNVKIGKNCLIGALVAIGGSAQIGDEVCIWGGAYIERKVKIGNGATIRAGSAVFSDVGENETWAGNPAKIQFKENE